MVLVCYAVVNGDVRRGSLVSRKYRECSKYEAEKLHHHVPTGAGGPVLASSLSCGPCRPVIRMCCPQAKGRSELELRIE